MKRLVILVLAAALLLVGCGTDNREYDEDEVKIAAARLIKQSQELNDIFWGTGIAYIEDGGYKNGYYYPADPVALRDLGYETVEDILVETAKVFSAAYTESIAASVFSAKVGDYSMMGYTRYYQEIDVIMVYTIYEPLLKDEVEYMYDQITVLGSEAEKVIVEIPIKVTRGELSQTRNITVDLVEEENGWRIDSPTYASYREKEVPK